MSRIFVSGATGHLGRLIVEGLLREGVAAADITAAGRATSKLVDLADAGISVVPVDYSTPATLEGKLAGHDVLMLVSASEPGNRFAQHKAVLDAAMAAGVQRIVYTSAPHATTSDLVLAPDHKATEEYIATLRIPTVILRNNWYTENYFGSIAEARAAGSITASVGAGRVASASRVDYADAAVAVLLDESHDGEVFELGGDVAWTFDELASAIAELIGEPVTYNSVSAEERLAGLKAHGLDDGTAGFVVALDGNIRDGALAEVTGELARLIGRPTTPLLDGLRAGLES